MEFIKADINFDFLGKRKIAFSFSLAVILIGIISLIAHKGLRYGIDFSGGTLIQIKFASPVRMEDIQSGLATIDLEKSTIQSFGTKNENEYLIRVDRIENASQNFTAILKNKLSSATGINVEIRRIEMVGPQVGKDLQEKALLAIFFSLLFISIYISGRFEFKWVTSGIISVALMGGVYLLYMFEVSIALLIVAAMILSLFLLWFFNLKYGMGAIVTLIHDVMIIIGIFSTMDKEFTLPVIAAILTIIGYSLNDTIVIFDRIRENLKKYQKQPMESILNKSLNETLSRTILTASTVLIVVLSLFFFGGEIIHDFAFVTSAESLGDK